jgi:hypothetical protein
MRLYKTYIGYWNFHSETNSVAGSIIVGNDLVLKLIDYNKTFHEQLHIDYVTGIAQDESNNVYHFILWDLRRQSYTMNTQGMQVYEYQVSYLAFSDHSDILNATGNNAQISCDISLKYTYLNWWCRSLLEEHNYKITSGDIDYHYTQPKPVLLSELESCNILAAIYSSTQTPQSNGFSNKLVFHIIIKQRQPTELNNCFQLIRQLEHLICLLVTIPVTNESINFKIGRANCICVQNIKLRHYNYVQVPDDYMTTSTIKDLLNGSKVRLWFDFYNKESYALGLFFDTIYNEELSDELRIICYSSVLEELTKRYYTRQQQPINTRKKRNLAEIIDVLKAGGHKDKANYLKTQYLDKDDNFETRLLCLLHKYKDVWEMINIDEFANKVVLTRNFLVHRQIDNKLEPYLYTKNEYSKIARTLRYVISATLLKELEFSNKDIERLLCIFGMWSLDDYMRVHPDLQGQAK